MRQAKVSNDSAAQSGLSGQLSRLLRKPWLVAVSLTTVMAVFRFILLGKSWFYFDDFEFLQDAHSGGISPDTLLKPIAGHVLVTTRFLTWLVLLPGEPSWLLARVILAALFAASCWSLWWMLRVCFDNPRVSLIPFTLYATSATVGLWAGWWASAIQEFTLAIALFNAIGWGVRYLRTPRLQSLAATYAWWLFGMISFEKSIVILLVLPMIAFSYFTSGGLISRIKQLWGKYRTALIATFVLAVSTSALYAWYVPEASQTKLEFSSIWPLLDVMLGKTLWTMLAAGPLQWSNTTGAVTPDPPAIYFNLVLVLVAGCFVYLAGQRRRVGRGVAMVAVIFVFAYGLLLVTRAVSMGAALGYLYRYQGEVFLVAVMALALALMPLRGSVESSEPRIEPLFRLAPSETFIVGLICLVSVFALVSTITYYQSWQVFPSRAESYLANLDKGASANKGSVIAGGRVPDDILWAIHGPYTKVENFIKPFAIPAKFDQPTTSLRIVDDKGHLRAAIVSARGETKTGPSKECGWMVTTSKSARLPMTHAMIPWEWWARMGYMAGTATRIQVTAGSERFQKTLPAGVGELYFPTSGDYDSLRVEVLTPKSTICLDKIVIGDAVDAQSVNASGSAP